MSSLNNSFNIFTDYPSNPELVFDEEISASVYVYKNKTDYFYGYDIGLEYNAPVTAIIETLGNTEGVKVDETTKSLMYKGWLENQLSNNGFKFITVNVDNYFQTKNIILTINKEQYI